jgi:hypothetical protein
MLDKSGSEPAEAIAEARASQILAEMLGIICHPEYYNAQQEQTVSCPPWPIAHVVLGHHRAL